MGYCHLRPIYPATLDPLEWVLGHSTYMQAEMVRPTNQLILQYSYLQFLDFLTTIAFLLNGVQEGNPIVRLAMTYSPHPLTGLIFIKIIAVGLGLYCWRMGRDRILMKMNWLFAFIVAWNLLSLILGAVGRGGFAS